MTLHSAQYLNVLKLYAIRPDKPLLLKADRVDDQPNAVRLIEKGRVACLRASPDTPKADPNRGISRRPEGREEKSV
jgi:hypothetical protein